MTAAYQCATCGADPWWSITRRGDVVVSWACAAHLSEVCSGLQRDFEVTELVVRSFTKAAEWAQIGQSLKDVLAAGTEGERG